MLDIHPQWFLVQMVSFLFLVAALNYILFQPILRLFDERKKNISDALESAKAMDRDKDDLLAQVDTKLAETQRKANTIFEGLSKAGLEQQKQSIDSARKEGEGIAKKARESLETETRKATESLRKDVEFFSKQIVEKMVGA